MSCGWAGGTKRVKTVRSGNRETTASTAGSTRAISWRMPWRGLSEQALHVDAEMLATGRQRAETEAVRLDHRGVGAQIRLRCKSPRPSPEPGKDHADDTRSHGSRRQPPERTQPPPILKSP